jgi:hypothetical protein
MQSYKRKCSKASEICITVSFEIVGLLLYMLGSYQSILSCASWNTLKSLELINWPCPSSNWQLLQGTVSGRDCVCESRNNNVAL